MNLNFFKIFFICLIAYSSTQKLLLKLNQYSLQQEIRMTFRFVALSRHQLTETIPIVSPLNQVFVSGHSSSFTFASTSATGTLGNSISSKPKAIAIDLQDGGSTSSNDNASCFNNILPVIIY